MNLLINVAHPVTPTIIKNAQIGNYMFGVAYAFMAMGQLVSSFFWGNYAKKKGDIHAISMGLFIYCIGQYLFYRGNSSISIILARFISGCGAGGFMVATISYLANISFENRAKNLTFYTALTVFSSTIGYLVGGLIGDRAISYVFIVQIIGLSLLMIGFKVLLTEEPIEPIEINHQNSFGKIKLSKKYVLLNLLVIISLIASTCYDQSFNYYIKDIMNFMPSQNGKIKAFVGVSAFVVSAIFSKKQKNKKEFYYLNIIFVMCSITIIGLTKLANVTAFLAVNTLFFVFNSLYLPILQNLYIRLNESADYSIISSNFNMCKSFGMILGALIAGLFYEFNPMGPFYVSCITFIIGILILFIINKGAVNKYE